ncbi:MAG: zinc ribbon domain-containing protein [Candidatus Tantalella remota]|nr:zinc ribbon domain-containing protein [Candidatus Tantalella remota]
MRICPQCGEMSDKWRLCGKCGIRLEDYRPDRKSGKASPPKTEVKPAPAPEPMDDRLSLVDKPHLAKISAEDPPVQEEPFSEQPAPEAPLAPPAPEMPKEKPYIKERTFHQPPTGTPFAGERSFASSPAPGEKETSIRGSSEGTIKVHMQLSLGTLIKTIAVVLMAIGAFFILLSLAMLIQQKIYQVSGTHHLGAFFKNHHGLAGINDMLALLMRGHLSAAVWWGIVLAGGGYMLFGLKQAARWLFIMCSVLRLVHLAAYFYLPVFFSTVLYGYAKHPYFDAGAKISAIVFTFIYSGFIYLLTRPAIVAQFEGANDTD